MELAEDPTVTVFPVQLNATVYFNNYYIARFRYSITMCMQTEAMHTFQIHYPSEISLLSVNSTYSDSTDGAQYHSSYYVYSMWIEFAELPYQNQYLPYPFMLQAKCIARRWTSQNAMGREEALVRL